MSSLGIEPDIDLEQLLRVASSDEYSVQFSPMLRGPGGEQGGTIIREAAPWKGLTKRPNESFSEYQSRLGEVNEGVAEGLGKARQMALNTAEDASGVALVEKGGQTYPIPAGAALMMEESGNGSIVTEETFPSVNAAVEKMATMGEGSPRFPTVY